MSAIGQREFAGVEVFAIGVAQTELQIALQPVRELVEGRRGLNGARRESFASWVVVADTERRYEIALDEGRRRTDVADRCCGGRGPSVRQLGHRCRGQAFETPEPVQGGFEFHLGSEIAPDEDRGQGVVDEFGVGLGVRPVDLAPLPIGEEFAVDLRLEEVPVDLHRGSRTWPEPASARGPAG